MLVSIISCAYLRAPSHTARVVQGFANQRRDACSLCCADAVCTALDGCFKHSGCAQKDEFASNICPDVIVNEVMRISCMWRVAGHITQIFANHTALVVVCQRSLRVKAFRGLCDAQGVFTAGWDTYEQRENIFSVSGSLASVTKSFTVWPAGHVAQSCVERCVIQLRMTLVLRCRRSLSSQQVV